MIVGTVRAFAEESVLSHDSSLEPVLRVVEPAVRLIPERHLRKLLHYLADAGRVLPTNTALPFWVSRVDLATADVLPRAVMAGAEMSLLLMIDPNDRLIDGLPREQQLLAYWRVLFQAAVMREIDLQLVSGGLSAAVCTERLGRFNPAAVREIRHVLEAEHLVAAGADDVALFRAFAATYLDLATFNRQVIEAFFPSLPSVDAVSAVMGAGLDVVALLARMRPNGSADAHREPEPDERWTASDTVVAAPLTREQPSGISDRAMDAERKGNNVRAAILRTHIAAALAGEERERALAGAQIALGKLVDALGTLFAWEHDTRQEWRQALAPLLTPASVGVWPRAARCLYELQKIPADLSREVFAVDLPETIRTFGRRPVKRPLPHARPVLILMGLKRAHAQLLRAGLGHATQFRLDRLFHHQLHDLEHGIRHEFTPILVDSLSRAGFTVTDTVEEVARDKVVAELLDRVCDRGYLRIGDLRDAVARNRMKMADLAGPVEFIRGDALLRADTNLAYALDGVYRKGEFYLRWLQRFSGLFFGTFLGRLFTLFVALPFGGAFMTLMFAEEMRHIGESLVKLVVKPLPKTAPVAGQPARPTAPVQLTDKIDADEVEIDDDGELWIHEVKPGTIMSDAVEWGDDGDIVIIEAAPRLDIVTDIFIRTPAPPVPAETPETAIVTWPTVIGLGVFLLLMFHMLTFRGAVLVLLGHIWYALRTVLWDSPVGLWRSSTVREIRQSRPVRFVFRHFWSPLLITMVFFAVMFLLLRLNPLFSVYVNPLFLLRWGWVFWATLTLVYNTPWGWLIQDRIAEALSDWWRVVRVNLLPGLLAWLFDLFRRLGNFVERQLYAVDEWLRYRGGDSQGSLAVKAILGLIWFPIAYVFRFAFNLLVEPQINPIKHFPVVTVSHKMLLPLVVSKDLQADPSMFGGLIAAQTGWAVGKANFWAFWIVAGVPGIFGFMAWEFLANWLLYRANRGTRLWPVTLGSHGETMRGLLRLGFHSGTVPKLFRKLRRPNQGRAAQLHHDLNHAVEAIERFVDRELVHLLRLAPAWAGVKLSVGEVQFGCQRLTVSLNAPEVGRDPFILAFENVGGKIEATLVHTGWADKLTEAQREAFVAALRGLLDMAAAERVNNCNRSDEALPATGFADLARRMTWAEWVSRWSTPTDPR